MTSAASAIVFIIDDDARMRAATERLLKTVGLHFESFATPENFLQKKLPDGPSCLVLDVRLPGMSGLELQSKLNEAEAQIPIIFITGHGDIPMTVKAMKSGAVEFLTKPFRDQDLIDRIQKALARDMETRQSLQEHGRIRLRIASLTPREREVLDLLTSGKANKRMAQDLGLSQRTIEIHRAHVMEKMDAKSVAQLVRMVMDLEYRGAQPS